jgi:charged multivesicular body protein 2A
MGNKVPKKTPQEIAKDNKRVIERSCRHLERERKKLEREEPKILGEIKKLATKGLHGPAKIRAKDLARTRSQVGQLYILGSQLKGVSMQLASVSGNAAVMEALQKSTEAISAVEGAMNVKDIMQMMKDYSKESEKLGMKQEMMGDVMEEVLDTGDVDADANKIYSQICDDINVDYENDAGPISMGHLGSGGVKNSGVENKNL